MHEFSHERISFLLEQRSTNYFKITKYKSYPDSKAVWDLLKVWDIMHLQKMKRSFTHTEAKPNSIMIFNDNGYQITSNNFNL